MIRMVKVYRQSVAFCKYFIAGILWLAVVLMSVVPVYIVLAIFIASALLGVNRAPLVVFFNKTFAKRIKTDEEYINVYSMRFAHLVGTAFCVFALISYYLNGRILALVLIIILAIMQTIASAGYCSAQKLYECVICNSNCCRIGKRIKRVKKNDR